mmetsp:Transcript_17364/g.36427  ORF Transcript_17364/g.36427 Transcript_17364/m.36427 type:complete len:262 (-) Transcript_17364:179-964(-)
MAPTKKSPGKLNAFIGGCRNALKRKSSQHAGPPPKSAQQNATAPDDGAFPRSPLAQTMTMPTTPPPQESENIVTIQSREGEDDDVSTLHDPFVGLWGDVIPEPHADNTVDESMISSEHKGYVWAVGRQRLDTGGGSTITDSMGASITGGSAFTDDNTLEGMYGTQDAYHEKERSNFESLTVVAPSGKLGIIVDNQTGDMPVVVAIKETSVLHGKIKEGDMLISVDEIDCRGMSSMQVSKLISSRSHNPTRYLVLGRSTYTC